MKCYTCAKDMVGRTDKKTCSARCRMILSRKIKISPAKLNEETNKAQEAMKTNNIPDWAKDIFKPKTEPIKIVEEPEDIKYVSDDTL